MYKYKFKAIILFFTLILIIGLLIFKVPVINAFNLIDSSISIELIKNYYSNDLLIKNASENELIKKILKTIKYNNWIEYIDYIELTLYFSNIIPNGEKELIAVLNLSKDSSIVCIFTKEGDIYQFHSLIDNLMPINKIEFYNIPEKNYNLMVIFQTLDERLGAFIYEDYFDIYIYKIKGFEKILSETIYYEEIFKKQWLDESISSNLWIKNISDNNVTFISNSQLLINIIGKNITYTADVATNYVPSKEDFILKNSTDYEYTYYWNKIFQNFSMTKEFISYNGLKAIIQKYNILNNKFINSNKYKILTSSGKILYVNWDFLLKH